MIGPALPPGVVKAGGDSGEEKNRLSAIAGREEDARDRSKRPALGPALPPSVPSRRASSPVSGNQAAGNVGLNSEELRSANEQRDPLEREEWMVRPPDAPDPRMTLTNRQFNMRSRSTPSARDREEWTTVRGSAHVDTRTSPASQPKRKLRSPVVESSDDEDDENDIDNLDGENTESECRSDDRGLGNHTASVHSSGNDRESCKRARFEATVPKAKSLLEQHRDAQAEEKTKTGICDSGPFKQWDREKEFVVNHKKANASTYMSKYGDLSSRYTRGSGA